MTRTAWRRAGWIAGLALLLASGVYVLRVASILAADLAIALAQADACGCRPMARTVVDELKRRKRRAQ